MVEGHGVFFLPDYYFVFRFEDLICKRSTLRCPIRIEAYACAPYTGLEAPGTTIASIQHPGLCSPEQKGNYLDDVVFLLHSNLFFSSIQL